MPKYCAFTNGLLLHHVTTDMPIDSVIVMSDGYLGKGKDSITGVSFRQRDILNPLSTWYYSSREDWENTNRDIVAESLIHSINPNFTYKRDTSVEQACDMPVHTIGIDDNLSIVMRNNEGWFYFEDTEFVFSTSAPDRHVVCSTRAEDTAVLAPSRYWVTVYKGQYVLVPPIDTDNYHSVPHWGVNNSRFSFCEENYVKRPVWRENEYSFKIDGEWRTIQYSKSLPAYGNLKLQDSSSDGVYYTLDMRHANQFGFDTTLRMHMMKVSAFNRSMGTFCEYVQNHYGLRTPYNTRVDSVSGNYDETVTSFVYGRRNFMSNLENVFHAFHVVEDEFIQTSAPTMVSNVLSYMTVDSGKNKHYTPIDTSDIPLAIKKYAAWSPWDNNPVPMIVNGEIHSLVWDARNKSWIDNDCAIEVPSGITFSSEDVYTHKDLLDDAVCPLCGSKTYFPSDHYFVHRYINGVEDTIKLCQNCYNRLCSCNHLQLPDGVLRCNDIARANNGELWLRSCMIEDDDGWLQPLAELCNYDDETKTWTPIDDAYTIVNGRMVERYCTRIHSYGYKPSPKFANDDGSDKGNQKYFGVELELMHGGELNSKAKSICKNNPYIYAKHDGSLDDGIELVTHPCTLKFHFSKFGWDEIMRRAELEDYEAVQGSGIHVHVSKSFWRGTYDVANACIFFDMNREATRIFANRSQKQFAHWVEPYLDKTDTADLIKFAMKRFKDEEERKHYMWQYYNDNTEHYRGVNLSNDETVEFRFFSSTMDEKRMYSILQFVDSLTALSKGGIVSHIITYEDIKQYATEKGYNELLSDPYFKKAYEYAERNPPVLTA